MCSSDLETPITARRYAVATASKAAGSSDTLCVFDLLLDPQPVLPSAIWPCRESGSGLGASATITPAYVWVGWRSTSTSVDPDTIESVSVFEVW